MSDVGAVSVDVGISVRMEWVAGQVVTLSMKESKILSNYFQRYILIQVKMNCFGNMRVFSIYL